MTNIITNQGGTLVNPISVVLQSILSLIFNDLGNLKIQNDIVYFLRILHSYTDNLN